MVQDPSTTKASSLVACRKSPEQVPSGQVKNFSRECSLKFTPPRAHMLEASERFRLGSRCSEQPKHQAPFRRTLKTRGSHGDSPPSDSRLPNTCPYVDQGPPEAWPKGVCIHLATHIRETGYRGVKKVFALRDTAMSAHRGIAWKVLRYHVNVCSNNLLKLDIASLA